MPARSRELAEDDVFNMTCDKLRKECKKKRLSSVGKKSELQFRLVEFLQNMREAERQEQQETIHEEENEQEEPMETEQSEDVEEEANRTFTVDDGEEKHEEEALSTSLHEGTPTNAVALVLDEDSKRKMCANLGVDLQNFEVKSRTRVHRLSSRKSIRPADVEIEGPAQQEEESTTENRGVTPVRQRAPSRGVDRFAMIHARDMEKMESLGEHRERVQKRHDVLTSNVPEAFKRLATPKSLKKREPISGNIAAKSWQPQNPAQMSFQFGSNDVNTFSELTNTREETGECSTSTIVPKKPTSRARAHVDVKNLTKIPKAGRLAATPKAVKAVTRPLENTFVEYISTPKGVTPQRTPKRGGYTPHAGKKVFVDTTQLTDREYTLASEEGLIPGKPATKTRMELRQMESKKRRDDIIALKRKMNVK